MPNTIAPVRSKGRMVAAARTVVLGVILIAASNCAPDFCSPGTIKVEGRAESDGRVLGGIDMDTLDRICPEGCPAVWCATQADDGRLTRHGPFASRYEDGQRNASGSYRNGKRDGVWVGRYENGARRYVGTWVAGAKVGVWTKWHPNGRKLSEGAYRGDRKVGLWISFRETGNKWLTWSFVDGRLSGTMTTWNGDGTVRRQAEVTPGRY